MAFSVGAVVAQIDADITGFQNGIRKVESEARGISHTLSSVGDGIAGFGRQAAIFTGVVAAGFGLIAKNAIDSSASFEQSRIAFETMLGSADKAKKLMRDISDFAMKTPFELPQLVDGSKRLLAYNLQAEEIIPTMQMLGNITAGVGTDKLPQLILAFGQVKAATRLTGMELRQFSEAGVPLLDALAKQSGKTAGEIQDMVSAGDVSFEDVQKALQGMTGEGGKFFDLMAKQSMTFGGVMSNIKDQVGRLMRTILGVDEAGNIAEGSIFAKVKQGADALLSLLNRLAPIITGPINQAIADISYWFGQLVIFLQPLGQWVMDNQELVIKFLQAAGVGFTALLVIGTISALLMALLNPLTLVGLGIAALFLAWQNNFMNIQGVTQQVINFIIDLFNNVFKPMFELFVGWWTDRWEFIKIGLLGTWEIIKGIIQLGWAIIYGILSVGLAILQGDWGKAWTQLGKAASIAWEGIKNIFAGAINFIIGWGGTVFNNLVKPFEDAWKKISETVENIKNKLDFTKRNSPSVVDIVSTGVRKVNDALNGIDWGLSLTPMTAAAITNTSMGPAINNIVVSLDGAMVGSMGEADTLGERIGDSIIRKLQMNVRI